MEIRKANQEDAAEIANVHTNTWREAYKGLLPQRVLDDRPLFFRNRYELWKKVTADEAQVTFVADSGPKHGVVGFVNGSHARDEKYKDYAEVWAIYLLEKYHGQGVGFDLLKQYFDVFYERGFRKGYLWVLDENPTIRFYEKVGGKRTDDVKKDVLGGAEIDEVCYTWDNIKLERK